MTRHRTALPIFAEMYLKENPGHHPERLVVLFHRWLAREDKPLETLTVADVQRFLERPARGAIHVGSRANYRFDLRKYLTWLAANGFAAPFDPEDLKAYHRKPMAESVRTFLKYLASIRQPGTIATYRYALRGFHDWLATTGLELAQVDRAACQRFAEHLHERGLHPATRVGVLVSVRKYLDWLWERGLVRESGSAVVLAEDLPKKPDYLPRPLPPDADRELQDRLRASEKDIGLGLYVMRRAGLRVGELRRLERKCVVDDNEGRHFLKVPLGKLHNERLVPLDADTYTVLARLQAEAPEASPWLLTGARGRPRALSTYQAALNAIAGDLPIPDPLTTRRLRHSFATSLMEGGMSLMGIMKLLGHRDYRMTLRYTAISDDTVRREYFEALGRIGDRYEIDPELAFAAPEFDRAAALENVSRWISTTLRERAEEKRNASLVHELVLLVRRLDRDAVVALRGALGAMA